MRRGVMAIVFGALLCGAAQAHAAVSLTSIGTFDEPSYVTAPRGDAHRIFVVERTGKVRVMRDGTLLATPFLDLSGADLYRVGLTSIAFAPDYAQSGHVYALYDVKAHDPDNSEGIRIEVDEYTVGADPDQVDPASRRNLLDLDFSNGTDHDADFVEFGPDGLLYMTIGDALVDHALAQDKNAPRGKLLRIDPRPSGNLPYTIPPSNPWAAGGGMPEAFAYGLRNPWRFGFDANGDVVIGDVQEGGPEELDLLDTESGGGTNFGWPCFQGSNPKNTCDPVPANAVPPILEYPHTSGRCAIIAGRLVRDPSLPSLLGRFTYGDYCTGEIRSVVPASPAVSDDVGAGVSMPSFSTSSFGEDGCHHVYATGDSGEVMRIDEDPHPPCVLPTEPALGYTKGDGPVALDPAIELSDADSTTVSGATVAITAGFAAAQDELSFTNQNGITGSYDSSTGVLTLSGDAPTADYEAALRSVRYANSSDDPSTATRTVTVEATDSSSAVSAAATRDIAVAAVDAAPVVTTSPGTTPYRELPKTVDPGVVVTDPDDTSLASARVRISSSFQHGDELVFASRNGITGNYNSGTGVLTLTGTAPVARYQAALRSVRFKPASFHAPGRAVTLTANDGQRRSNAATRMLASTLEAGACANTRRGTAGFDFLTGTAAGDRLLGLGGRDLLRGLAGRDCLEGGGRSDRLEGDRGNDVLDGGRQGDRLSGGRGADRLSGDRGNDELSGGPGNDRLFGGRGNDRLFGGSGVNAYHGDAGDDRIEAANGVAEQVHCGSGRDRATVDAADRTTDCEHVTIPAGR